MPYRAAATKVIGHLITELKYDPQILVQVVSSAILPSRRHISFLRIITQ